jgi:hypothetical protein
MANSEELLSEATVLSRWPALSKSLLRIARQQGRISWVKGKRGSAWYRPPSVETFITKELEQPCLDHAPDRSLSSAGNGSLTTQDRRSSIDSGLNSELEERVALASAQRILAKQK